MTQDEILTCLGQSAEAPQLLEEHSTYTDDAGRRLPAPPGESFFEALPESISSLLAYYPDRALRTQQLLALLSLLGSVAIHCRVAHDNRQYGTTLMVLIYGSPASGKGRIAELLPLVQGIDRKVQGDSHREIRRAERQLEVQRLKRQRMAKSREVTDSEIERSVMGEEEIRVPLPRCHTMADNITVPALLEYMKGSEPHPLLLVATELLTIVQQAKTDYGNLRDLLLRAFHEERMSYAIKRGRDGRESIFLEHIRLGVLLSGTYTSLRQFMPTIDDGLASRFLFYETPSVTDWRTPMSAAQSRDFTAALKQVTALFESLHGALTRYDNCHSATPLPTLTLTDMQEACLDSSFSRMNDWYLGYTGTEEILSAVRRRIIDAKRIILLLSLLRGYEQHQSWDEVLAMPQITADDDDIGTTLTLIGYLMRHSVNAFAFIQPEAPEPDSSERLTAVRHLDLMPYSFTTADAIETGKQRGISERTTKRRIKAWHKAEFIIQLERGKYMKSTENTMEEVPNGTSHT